MALEITLLGPPAVRRDGEPVGFDTRKAMAMLAHLAVAERPRPRETLCELLWPAHDPERARGALRRTLSTLRSGVGEEWLDTAGDSIALVRGPDIGVDVDRFRALAVDESAPAQLDEAAALFGGDFLEGFSLRDSADFDHWQQGETGALRRELSSVLRRLIEALVARGDVEQALPHARRWLALDPMHEPAHRELIRLYAWTGDRAAALEQYRDCVRVLSRELGVAPLEETAALYEEVNEGTLAPAAPPAPAATLERGAPPPELPLVGREAELAALIAVHSAAAPDGRLAVIEGEAGIGKTRLAEELARVAAARGAIVVGARCHDDEAGLAYGPIVELLREALRRAPASAWDGVLPQHLADASLLVPELGDLREGDPAPLPLEGPGATGRLLEAVVAVIEAACAGPAPGVVLVDDVHAADEATLDAVSFLGRRLAGRPLLLVVTWRSERVQPGHRLRRLAADLARDATAVIVSPGRLDEKEVAELVGADDPELLHRVFVESEGLPLFVAELVSAMTAGDEPSIEARGMLDARLGRLGDVARQVLGAAAAIGRSFDIDTVRETSGRSETETVDALDELIAHGVVREMPGSDPAYDFSHEKIRSLVYEQTTQARRRLLHGRAATALAARTPGPAGAAVVAQQARLAGDHAAAAAHHRLAADHAVSLHAHADALEHLEAALGLGDEHAPELHERIGDLRTGLGDYVGALAAYESAAALSEGAAAAAAEQKLGEVLHRRGDWERAESRFLAALELVPSTAPGLRARIQADLGLTLHQAGHPERAAELARDSLRLAEEAGDVRARAQAHNMLGALSRSAGGLDAAREQLQQSLALARELGDEPAEAAALNNLALVERDGGNRGRALSLTEEALALCAVYGDRHREAALENNIADLHHAAGRPDESMEHLKRAVAIFSEVGADEATRLPEIWKLVSW